MSCTENFGNDQPVRAVYELREAAVEHGRAVTLLEAMPLSARARDNVLVTQATLEEKTVAAIDECSDNAEEAREAALDETS